MVRMRHPKLPATTADVPESAVGIHRMSGWLTDEEWTRAGLVEDEPEPSGEQEADQDSSKQTTTRRRPRATTEGAEA